MPHTGIQSEIAAPIPAADFACLGEQVREAEYGGAGRIHFDVMDGRFVPKLSMGTEIAAAVRKVTQLPPETYLMITNPDCFLKTFADAGSDSFIAHGRGTSTSTAQYTTSDCSASGWVWQSIRQRPSTC